MTTGLLAGFRFLMNFLPILLQCQHFLEFCVDVLQSDRTLYYSVMCDGAFKVGENSEFMHCLLP